MIRILGNSSKKSHYIIYQNCSVSWVTIGGSTHIYMTPANRFPFHQQVTYGLDIKSILWQGSSSVSAFSNGNSLLLLSDCYKRFWISGIVMSSFKRHMVKNCSLVQFSWILVQEASEILGVWNTCHEKWKVFGPLWYIYNIKSIAIHYCCCCCCYYFHNWQSKLAL